jgi:hypothetical protein
MPFKPAPRIRKPARPMQPLIDPADWTAAELAADDGWIYALSDAEADEVSAAVAKLQTPDMDILALRQGDFSMPRLDKALFMLKGELDEGRGFVLIRGIPVAGMDRAGVAAAFWGIGTRFGAAVCQNGQGHMLGHVKDIGGDPGNRNTRGYLTADEIGYHCDPCDYVGLLCLHPAKSGGWSRIASTVGIYNEMLKRCPDLLNELIADYYFSRHAEVSKGERPWYKQAMFSFHEGYFTGRSPGDFALRAQGLPGVPDMTRAQHAAFKAFRDIAGELHFAMDFRQGDMQLLNNAVVSHSRGEFEDWPEPENKRHLIRLWLTDAEARPMIPGLREMTHGVAVKGVPPTAPLDVAELV